MTQKEPFRIIGLTGGIASGKSTAARYFVEAGIPVVDADQIARELRAPGGGAYEAIQKRFGTADREKLRTLIFQDFDARRDLEAILHPLIQAESLGRMRNLGVPVVLYEAALLVETGRHQDLDGLIAVTADPEIRIRRLMARDGSSEDEARRILSAQSLERPKIQLADWVINNSTGLAELKRQVYEIAPELLNPVAL